MNSKSRLILLSRSSRLVPLTIIPSLLGLMVVILWVAVKSPPLSDAGLWSSTQVTITVVCVTMLATIYAALVAKALEPPMIDRAEVFFAWLHVKFPKLEPVFEWIDERMSHYFARPATGPSTPRTRARVFKFLLVLLIGQLATSIVVIFTPITVTLTKEYSLQIPGAGYFVLKQGDDPAIFPCTGAASPGVPWVDLTYKWVDEDGREYMTRFSGGKSCPGSRVVPLVASINTGNRSRYAYLDSGVAVHQSAMGAPQTLFRGPELMEHIALHGTSLFKTEQCVPVLVRNPVSCERKGSLETKDDIRVIFSLDLLDADGEPLIRAANFNYRNLTKDSVMLNYLFSGSDFTKSTVGHGIIAVSGITDPKWKTPFAGDLARVMNESEPYTHQNYTAVCTVQATNSFEYRTVTLHLDNRNEEDENDNNNNNGFDFNGYTRFLSAGDRCVPKVETVGFPHYAAAMVAQYLPIMEGFPLDGRINSILRLANSNNKSDFAFSGSKNALEDVLGVIAALGVSTMNATDGVTGEIMEGIVSVDVTGFKSDPWPTALLLGPPVLTLLVIVWFYWPFSAPSCPTRGNGPEETEQGWFLGSVGSYSHAQSGNEPGRMLPLPLQAI
ncbi:hypothetical protein OQA88_3170 [Cercophora sp. LCS_1]